MEKRYVIVLVPTISRIKVLKSRFQPFYWCDKIVVVLIQSELGAQYFTNDTFNDCFTIKTHLEGRGNNIVVKVREA